MHRPFWAACAVAVAVHGIVVITVWMRYGEISYKGPRDFFGASPQERIRRSDRPGWYWCHIAVAVLVHLLFMVPFLLLISLRRP